MDGLAWIFAALTVVGMLYFLTSLIFGGDLGDFGLDLGIDFGFGGGDTDGGFGAMLVAAFLSGFGAIGLIGRLSDWNLLTTLLFAAVVGLVLGRAVVSLLKFVVSQQSESIRDENLIGSNARVTIDVPAGKTGEAILEGTSVEKHTIRAVDDDEALSKGDSVTVVNIQNGILYVRKI